MIDSIDIRQLIPQRQPIMMVDQLVDADEQSAVCQLTIRQDNFFLQSDGTLAETGIIEHMAQTASAHCGFLALQSGSNDEAPIGYIAEVKGFSLLSQPKLGDTLTTTIRTLLSAENVTVVSAETNAQDRPIATTQLKISLKE